MLFGNGGLADAVRMASASHRMALRSCGSRVDRRGDRDPGKSWHWVTSGWPPPCRLRRRSEANAAGVRHATSPRGCGGCGTTARARVYELGQIADSWLNLGEVEKGRELLLEAFQLLEAIPPPRRSLNRTFLATAARIDLERVLSLIKDATTPANRQSCLVVVAASLANEHPAEAERVFRLFVNGASDPRLSRQKSMLILHLCHRMAKVDPERARRILAGLNDPAEQSCAWALLAIGLADRDKPAALGPERVDPDHRSSPRYRPSRGTPATTEYCRQSGRVDPADRGEKYSRLNVSKSSSGERSPSCRKTTPSVSASAFPMSASRCLPSSWLVTTVKWLPHWRGSTRSCDLLLAVASGTSFISSGPRPRSTHGAPWR